MFDIFLDRCINFVLRYYKDTSMVFEEAMDIENRGK